MPRPKKSDADWSRRTMETIGRQHFFRQMVAKMVAKSDGEYVRKPGFQNFRGVLMRDTLPRGVAHHVNVYESVLKCIKVYPKVYECV